MPCILADLPAGACHWPLDDPGPGHMDEAMFCAEPVPFEGCRYCETHMRIAHQPSAESRKARRLAEARAALFRLKLKGGDMADTDNPGKFAGFPEPMPPHSREHLDELLTPEQTDKSAVCSGLRPVAPVDLPGATPGEPPTAVPMVEMMAPGDLLVDEAYQRNLGPKSYALIRQIVERWDWRRFKPPIVAWTEAGFEIIDGQHTAIAAATHPAITKIPVLVVEAVQMTDRAQAFVGHNRDRLNVSAMQLHHALVAAGDDDAVTIEQVCQRAGVVLVRSAWGGYAWKAGETKSVDGIRALVGRRGAQKARHVLETLVQAGAAPIQGNQIKAAEMLLTDPQYADQLEPYPQNVADLAQAIRAMGAAAEKDAMLFAKANCIPLWKALAATWFSKTKKRRKAA